MSGDFRDIVAELMQAGVRFMVVGAHALSVHGVPRATADLDIWIDRTPENASRVWKALAAFGAPLDSLGVAREDLLRADVVVQIGLPPLRVDLMTGLSGVTFAEAWPSRLEAEFEGVRVPFLGREALIRNKTATGRMKDLGDLESLGES
ncbi:MAG: hypothetical protein ACYCVL_11825 [Gemmatimonadaceae bacterium]